MGARQTGKSTLVQSEPFLAESPGRLYLTLDDLTVRERARANPEELLRSAPRLTLDEVQREPDLILALKRVVDQDRPRQPGRFVVTGSANLLLMQRISETLAGRATYVTLWPLTRREKLGLGRVGLAQGTAAGEPAGAHLENLVLVDLLAWRHARIPRPEILYWRTTTGLEVDFVIEHAGGLIPIEVKAGGRPGTADLKGLTAFRDEYPDRFHGGLLLHDGEDTQWLSERILATPWHRVV